MTRTAETPERGVAAALLEDWLAEQRRRLGIVGLAGGIALPTGETLTAAHGLADRERGRPMAVDTPLRAASITKIFSVTAMMMARNEGLLSLDAPVSRLVPELSSVISPAQDGAPITLRQVASHTAGLPHDLPYGARYWDQSGPDVVFPRADEMRHHLDGLRLISPPMTTAHYSNVGFMIVGLALEAAFGRPCEEVVRDRILVPLQMADSFFWSPRRSEDLARGYRPRGSVLEPAPDFDIGWDNAGGGLCCSVADLLRFVALHLSDGPEGGAQVLGGSSVREMRQPVYLGAGADRFGLGWRLRGGDEFAMIAHSGGVGGFSAHMALVPALGIGVALLANTQSNHVVALTEAMLGSLVTLVGMRMRAEQVLRPEAPALDAEHIAQFTGRYATYGVAYDVIVAGGRLAIVVAGELDYAVWLEPTDVPGEFVGGDGFALGEPVAFRAQREGKFTELMLQGQVFGRVP